MKRAWFVTLAVVLACCAVSCGAADCPPAAAVPAPVQAPEQGSWDDGLDERVKAELEEWRVPGTAIAVVSADGELYAGGFGVRSTVTGKPFDLDTVFPIGSVSKTFTAAAVGRFVDQGKLDWDDPVIKHYPAFEIGGDPAVTKRVTIRDLLSHRSGLGAHAIDAYIMPRIVAGQPCEKADLLSWAKALKPAHGLRQRAAYSNLGYVFIGELIAKVSGQSWASFIQTELLAPLGMTSTVIGAEAFEKIENRSAAHELGPEGEVAPIPAVHIGSCIEGAGDMSSSARDLMTWLRLMLQRGKHGDQQVLSEATVNELLRPQMLEAASPFHKTHHGSGFRAQTLGWETAQYKGSTLVRMGGSGPGFQSALMLMPGENVGVVVVENFSAALFHVTMSYEILDRYTQRESSDWVAIYRQVLPKIPKRAQVPILADKREDYIGTYDKDGFVRKIVLEDEHLYLLGTTPVGGPPLWGRARLFGLEDDSMFIKTADAIFRFRRDEGGKVVGFDEVFAGEHRFVKK